MVVFSRSIRKMSIYSSLSTNICATNIQKVV